MFSWTIVKYANALNCHVKLLRCSVGKLGNCLHGKSELFKTIFVLLFLVNESCSELFVRLTGHGEKMPDAKRKGNRYGSHFASTNFDPRSTFSILKEPRRGRSPFKGDSTSPERVLLSARRAPSPLPPSALLAAVTTSAGMAKPLRSGW